MLLPALLLLAALAPQGDEGRRIYFDGVAIQAGDEIITLSELNRFETERLREQPVTTEEERRELRGNLLRELSWLALEAQAGEELGLDPEAVRLQVQFAEEEERERVGITAYADRLTAEGTTAYDAYEDREADLLRILWRRSQLGYQVADQRPTTDRYVRPGELAYSFRLNRELLAPTRVRFRILAVPAAAAGGPDLARRSCEEARRRVLEGEDLADLVDELGAAFRETQGLTPLLALPEVRDPLLAELAEEEAGTLSEVLPLPGPQGPDPELGWQIVQVAEKVVPEPPRFEDAEVQERLRSVFANQRDGRVMQRERGRLASEAYTWVHPALRGPGTTARPAGAGSQ